MLSNFYPIDSHSNNLVALANLLLGIKKIDLKIKQSIIICNYQKYMFIDSLIEDIAPTNFIRYWS